MKRKERAALIKKGLDPSHVGKQDFSFARNKFTRDIEGARRLILWLANHYDVGNRDLRKGVLRVVDEFLAETGDDFTADCARIRLDRVEEAE